MLWAPPTSESLLWGHSQVLGVYVCLVVLRQVVAPHESLLTLVALKALVSCQEGGSRRSSSQKVLGPDTETQGGFSLSLSVNICFPNHILKLKKYVKNNQQPPAVGRLFCSFSYRLPRPFPLSRTNCGL